jgi:hypothetical protein
MTMLETDSTDYHVLAQAVQRIRDVPGMICEIGTRMGGSLHIMIHALIQNQDLNRNLVYVDPYGDIPYKHDENSLVRMDYTNHMKYQAQSLINQMLLDKPVNAVFLCMEDTEFFQRFADGVPFYQSAKKLETQYALVFIDGPHDAHHVWKEFQFFSSRCVPGACMVFDDVSLYDHDQVEQNILSMGWQLVDKTTTKACYQLPRPHVMFPQGGTEILRGQLTQQMPSHVWSHVNLISSVCDPDLVDPCKINVLWQHLHVDQPHVQLMQSPEFVNTIDQFVFVSHWQFQQYQQQFKMPAYKCVVIPNATQLCGVPAVVPDMPRKLVYASMPNRGLDVLLKAWELIQAQNCELHIYSSTLIYGADFHEKHKHTYDDVFHKARSLNHVHVHGFVPHDQLLHALDHAHILVYPSTYAETSCLAAIEALIRGLTVVTTNLGALPETCASWAHMVPYGFNHDILAYRYAEQLQQVLQEPHTCNLAQIAYYNQHHGWPSIIPKWNKLFHKLIQDRT